MIKSILFLVSLFSTGVFAETEFDSVLIKQGIVDSQYRIVDYKTFDETMRAASSNVASMLPSRIDADTTVMSLQLSRFGFYSSYRYDEIETQKDAEYLMHNFGLAQKYKNYMCSMELSKSEVFKRLNSTISMSVLNSQHEVIYRTKFKLSDC